MRHTFNLHPADSGRFGHGFGRLEALCRLAWQTNWLVCLLFVGVVSPLVTPTASAEDSAPLDYQVKAAFIVNFPKYVDWPATAFAETNSPIVVTIFGDDNIAGEFGNMIKGGRTIGGRPLVLRRVNKEEDVTADCQILFIANSEKQRAQAILNKVKGLGILTVGESEDFLEKGGVVNLIHRDRKIRLQVNLSAAGQASLKISSRLLMAADVVKGKPE